MLPAGWDGLELLDQLLRLVELHARKGHRDVDEVLDRVPADGELVDMDVSDARQWPQRRLEGDRACQLLVQDDSVGADDGRRPCGTTAEVVGTQRADIEELDGRHFGLLGLRLDWEGTSIL